MERNQEEEGNNQNNVRHDGGNHAPHVIIDEENNPRNVPRPMPLRAEDRQVAIGFVNQEIIRRAVTIDEESKSAEPTEVEQSGTGGEAAVPYQSSEIEEGKAEDEVTGVDVLEQRWVNSLNANSRQSQR